MTFYSVSHLATNTSTNGQLQACLTLLSGGHRKSALEFNYLETGTLKLRHILTYRRLMFHHDILKRDDQETIGKIYMKHKEDPLKGDWFTLIEFF